MPQENNEVENLMFIFYQQKTLLAAVHGTYLTHFISQELK
jgi:hypothetical protein